LDLEMSRTRLIWALASTVAALALAAGPAQAGQVTVVSGDHAVKENDPSVPSKAETFMRGPTPAAPLAVAAASSRGTRAVTKALKVALKKHAISRSRYNRYRRIYSRARSLRRKLRGARRTQLGYVIAALESVAARGKLGNTRMPAQFAQLERNTRYWRSLPYPASGDQVTFKGSEVLYQYYPGRGLQLQPLSTFIKASNMHGACVKHTGPCRKTGLKRLLNEMTSFAVRRSSRFIAWEYMFTFDGGTPPWMSGMAQATAIQAYARASQLLNQPGYVTTAKRALPAFKVHPPLGVRTRGPRGGVTYLQYSFAPRLYIFNAFTQALLGLYDYAKITGDQTALARYNEAEPELRRMIPFSDLGDWTLYNYRGHEANANYHELLREVLASMCTRKLGDIYCTYAKKYRHYQIDPPVLDYTGPDEATKGEFTRLRFTLSRLSVVELNVYKGSKLAFHKLLTFRRGSRYFLWKPKSSGDYTVRISAKELRTGLGKHGRTNGELTVSG
jgi:D-glucuronyl C5-epimerase C-terminus